MKTLCFVLFLVVAATSLGSAQAPNTNDYSFTISGSQTWTDTGVDFAAGDVLTVNAEPKAGSDSSCNPQGTVAVQSAEALPLPAAAAGTVIGRTAEKGQAAVLGAGGELRAADAGHLFLGINQASPSNCAYVVKVKISHEASGSAQPVAQNAVPQNLPAQAAAASSATGQSPPAQPTVQAAMREKISSAAQVFLKGQFGTGGSTPSESTNAVSGKEGVSSSVGGAPGGLKLPSLILDANLKKSIDGLPRRVHDHLGNLGDMVNFVFVGSQENVQAALAAADWHVADVDNKEAGLKAVLNTYKKKDYLEMPMSHLYLFDRMQDFGYEQAQAFSVVATRHHFRVWKAPFTWNNETVWVGAATHDTGFEKDVRTGKLTHKIDPNVDAERDGLADGLQKTGKTKGVTYYLPPDPVQEAKNASGGSYHSDGRLLVVFLN